MTQGQERCHFVKGTMHHSNGITLEGGQVSLFQIVWFLQDRGGESFEGLSFEEQDGDDAVDALYSFALSRPDLPWMFFILKCLLWCGCGVSSSFQYVSCSPLRALEGWDSMDVSSLSYRHNSQQYHMGWGTSTVHLNQLLCMLFTTL